MDGPVHGMVPAGPHGLPDLVHEKAGGLFGDPEAHARIACGEALGGGGHLETDEECLMHPEPHPVEKRAGGGGFGMATDVAGPRKILALLGGTVATPGT